MVQVAEMRVELIHVRRIAGGRCGREQRGGRGGGRSARMLLREGSVLSGGTH